MSYKFPRESSDKNEIRNALFKPFLDMGFLPFPENRTHITYVQKDRVRVRIHMGNLINLVAANFRYNVEVSGSESEERGMGDLTFDVEFFEAENITQVLTEFVAPLLQESALLTDMLQSAQHSVVEELAEKGFLVAAVSERDRAEFHPHSGIRTNHPLFRMYFEDGVLVLSGNGHHEELEGNVHPILMKMFDHKTEHKPADSRGRKSAKARNGEPYVEYHYGNSALVEKLGDSPCAIRVHTFSKNLATHLALAYGAAEFEVNEVEIRSVISDESLSDLISDDAFKRDVYVVTTRGVVGEDFIERIRIKDAEVSDNKADGTW